VSRVLIVDDDPSIRQVIAFALGDEGHEVGEAADGRAALELIERWPPDLILLDMKMPGLDGWQFVKLYRARHGHRCPILALTAASDAAQRAAEVDADSYLAKPFDLDALLDRVNILVAKVTSE
jgi:DNA-binding response OmpR family regulator